MNLAELQQQLQRVENEGLDFKQQWHEGTIDLLHDILCLANAQVDGDRYLIFGVQNETRKLIGVASDGKQRKLADVYDLLRSSNLNRIPRITMHSFEPVVDVSIVVLRIANMPDKPYFLLKDKRQGQQTIRAGVVYTRLGDTNTPLAESAPEQKIEWMWRERLGIDLKPIERLSRLLDESNDWQEDPGRYNFHHMQYPEFTIVQDENGGDRAFSEPWCEGKFLDPHCSRYEFQLKYYSTVLETVTMVSCDGGRYMLPMPEIDLLQPASEDEEVNRVFFVCPSSIRMKVAGLFKQYFPLYATLERCGVEIRS
jgi:Putative DNA-binding domain